MVDFAVDNYGVFHYIHQSEKTLSAMMQTRSLEMIMLITVNFAPVLLIQLLALLHVL